MHYHFHSLYFWLQENSKQLFGVEPDTRQFENIIYGLSRVKKSMLGTLPPGKRPAYTYKGWRVISIDEDLEKKNKM